MSKNIVNRLFTTFLLLIAIILVQEMQQKYSDRRIIRIEKPKSRLVKIDNDSYPIVTRKRYIFEKKNILKGKS